MKNTAMKGLEWKERLDTINKVFKVDLKEDDFDTYARLVGV